MKFKVGDEVLITSGKDKGKKGQISHVIPSQEKVVVPGVNMYTKHVKPMAGRPGDKVRLERPMATAKIAILNSQGKQDRIGYSVDKKGVKTRIFKKTGEVVPDAKEAKKAEKAKKK